MSNHCIWCKQHELIVNACRRDPSAYCFYNLEEFRHATCKGNLYTPGHIATFFKWITNKRK
jgi:hypothetical protein